MSSKKTEKDSPTPVELFYNDCRRKLQESLNKLCNGIVERCKDDWQNKMLRSLDNNQREVLLGRITPNEVDMIKRISGDTDYDVLRDCMQNHLQFFHPFLIEIRYERASGDHAIYLIVNL